MHGHGQFEKPEPFNKQIFEYIRDGYVVLKGQTTVSTWLKKVPFSLYMSKRPMDLLEAAHKEDGERGYVKLDTLVKLAHEFATKKENADFKEVYEEMHKELSDKDSNLRSVLATNCFNGYLFEDYKYLQAEVRPHFDPFNNLESDRYNYRQLQTYFMLFGTLKNADERCAQMVQRLSYVK